MPPHPTLNVAQLSSDPGRRISAGYVWQLPETHAAGPVLEPVELAHVVARRRGLSSLTVAY
jgi:hypothetical protein